MMDPCLHLKYLTTLLLGGWGYLLMILRFSMALETDLKNLKAAHVELLRMW